MSVLDILPRLTERAWAGQVDRLAAMFGWAKWQDAATNAPRACPKCHEPIRLPRNTPGWPDRVYVRGETLWFVELKSPRGKLSPAQRDWLTALMGVKRVKVGIWRPRDADKIARELR